MPASEPLSRCCGHTGATVSPQPTIAVLFGTRPEAIKLAPVIGELRTRGVQVVVIATGQHRDMVSDVLTLFGIRPDYDLALMRPSQTLDHVLSSTLAGVGEILAQIAPAALVVQGDTTSTLGGALSAFHNRVPLGHVEAGLRSGRLDLPFPEEMNRRVTSALARWHFAPSETAADNLRREGVPGAITVTGNTVVDALERIRAQVECSDPDLWGFAGEGPLILATAHRRESWGGGIKRIARALADVLDALPDHRLIFATHPNPVAHGPVNEVLADQPRARVTTALSYGDFIALLARARLAITDSGGVQEEGPSLGIPVLVTRSVTERPEGVAAGAVLMVGTDVDRITRTAVSLLRDPVRWAEMARSGPGIYGDGRAAQRIVSQLLNDLRMC